MSQGRGPWYLLTGLLLGLIFGLVYTWLLDPVEYANAGPDRLAEDYQETYRSMIALSYQANGDLGRALGRLTLLKDENTRRALNAQAQRILVYGGSEKEAQALSELALQMESVSVAELYAQATESALVQEVQPTAEQIVSPTAVPVKEAENPEPEPTFTPEAVPTQEIRMDDPFVYLSTEEICDPGLPEGLLQIYVVDSDGEGAAGVKIYLAWREGEEFFFTGLYPQSGMGYADYEMDPDEVYSMRVGEGGEIVSDLTAPSCKDGDTTYWGSLLLRFSQP